MSPLFIERVAEFSAGFVIVAMISYDVFQSIIVPRLSSNHLRIAPFLIGTLLWPNYRRIALFLPERWREGTLEIFAPLGFVVLLLTWFTLLVTGYALMIYACGDYITPPVHDIGDAAYFAGTSVLTLGFGDIVASTLPARALVLSAAVLGLIFMALEVSLLFSLQNYLQLREQVVTTVSSRAGRPASGIVLLLRYRELNIVPTLSTSFVNWESWIATVLESHQTYPLLVYFRSSNRGASWFATIGAILDASTLLTTCISDVDVGEAELFYWLGTNTLKSIYTNLRLRPIELPIISEEQFAQGMEVLAASGFTVRDPALSYRSFGIRRASYMRYLAPIATHFALRLQVWTPDFGPAAQNIA